MFTNITGSTARPDNRPQEPDVAVNPKRALITGITGQDGSYLAEFLLAC